MNPGYLSLILISVILILLASGWKDILIKGASHKAILLFFITWFTGLWFTVHAGPASVNFVFAVIVLWSCILIANAGGVLYKLHLLSAGLLMASVYYLLAEISNDLLFIYTAPHVDAAAVLAVFAFLLNRSPIHQMAVISLGFVTGELYYGFSHKHETPVVLGDPRFLDEYWLTLIAARLLTLCLQTGVKGWQKTMHYITERKEGWKE